MRILLLILGVFTSCAHLNGQEDLEMTINHDGETRNFFLYIPSSYSANGPNVPLVFNFHGFTSNATQQRLYSDMNRVAEEEGFIVCYPNGIDASWNVGAFFGSDADDVGFTQTMIDTLSSLYNISLGRVYACGMSNGGFFSYQLACNLSDRIAAVASVTGSFSPNMMQNCEPSRKVPIMEVHGTDDAIVPYDGLAGTAEPIEDVIAFWVNHNNCDASFESIVVPDIDPNDGSTVSIDYYQQCDEEAEVLFAKVEGGGHTWPGSPIIIGSTNLDFDASQEIWNFFEKHKIDGLSSNQNLHEAKYLIYPNPTENLIYIDTRITKYTLLTIEGNVIKYSNMHTLDLGNQPSGIYLLQLESPFGIATKKIIKN